MPLTCPSIRFSRFSSVFFCSSGLSVVFSPQQHFLLLPFFSCAVCVSALSPMKISSLFICFSYLSSIPPVGIFTLLIYPSLKKINVLFIFLNTIHVLHFFLLPALFCVAIFLCSRFPQGQDTKSCLLLNQRELCSGGSHSRNRAPFLILIYTSILP